MDYNKLIRDIIKAARQDPAVNIIHPDSSRVVTTLKLEVKVSKTFPEDINEETVNSTKLLLIRIKD
jgi:hypothetical protein